MRTSARITPAAVLAGALLAGAVLAGCTAAPAPPPAQAPPATSPAQPDPGSPAAPSSPDEIVCADYRDRESLLRETAEALERMPVLPAGVSLLLLGVREVALTPGVQDPELAAAQVELVAAIDDLDAQSRRLLGPDDNAARDAVQLDAARILTALQEVERICGAPAF